MHEVARRALVVGLVAVPLAVGAAPRPLAAQEGAAGCDRLITGADQQAGADGITYLWSNFRAGCGDARMSADSAVVRERAGRLLLGRLIRGVRYRDSTRSLTSDSLTYSGADDRVVAMGNVVLTMTSSGIELAGPRVEFHRLTRSGAEKTVATERPRLTIRGEPGSGRPPTTIDADRMEIFREDNAWYWGDVEIRRPDAVSFADSAFFDMAGETGILYGGARVEGDDFELRGDSIRLVLTEQALRSVHAFHQATATGEEFDIASEQILVGFTDGDVDQVEAFGRRGGALSGGYHLLGDSLRFTFRDGAVDSTFAIGSAVAIEDTLAELGREPALDTNGEKGWLAGDTIVASFRHREPDGAALAAPPDTAGAEQAADPQQAGDPEVAGAEKPADARERSELEKIRTAGNARAFYVATDTTADGPPARNYLIGRQISIFFEGGSVARVAAEQAIGVYLDPDPNAPPPATDDSKDGVGPPKDGVSPPDGDVPAERRVAEGAAADTVGGGQAEGEEPAAARDSVESSPRDLPDNPRDLTPGNSP